MNLKSFNLPVQNQHFFCNIQNQHLLLEFNSISTERAITQEKPTGPYINSDKFLAHLQCKVNE